MAETPLTKKLGIKPAYKILLMNNPEGYQLNDLPEGAQVVEKASGPVDVVQLFAHNKAEIVEFGKAA